MTFEGEFWRTHYDPMLAKSVIEDGDIFIQCQLNMKEILEQEFYQIQRGEMSVLVHIMDNSADSVGMLTKGIGISSSKGVFTWTVEYVVGTRTKYLFPLTFEDVFDNTCHDFVEGSLKLNGATATPDSVSRALDTTTIQYTLPYTAGTLPAADKDASWIVKSVVGSGTTAGRPPPASRSCGRRIRTQCRKMRASLPLPSRTSSTRKRSSP